MTTLFKSRYVMRHEMLMQSSVLVHDLRGCVGRTYVPSFAGSPKDVTEMVTEDI